MDTYTIPPVGSRIILEVDLEHLLGASVALYVEEVGELTARNELVLARVDDLLQVCLSLFEIACKHPGFTSQCVSKSLGNAIGTVLVGSAGALCQIRYGFLTLLGNPLEILLLGHLAVGWDSRRIKQIVYERGLSPVACQQEEVVGAEHLCLGYSLLLKVGGSILEVVDHEVVFVNRQVQELVVEVDSLRCMAETELIDRAAPLVVTIVTAGVEDIVARVVGQYSCRGVDTRTFTVTTTYCVKLETLVCRSQRLLTIGICLVEVLCCHGALLFDVEFVFT